MNYKSKLQEIVVVRFLTKYKNAIPRVENRTEYVILKI